MSVRMAEEAKADTREAREQLIAEDSVVATLITAGDPGAELAIPVPALNGGSLARTP